MLRNDAIPAHALDTSVDLQHVYFEIEICANLARLGAPLAHLSTTNREIENILRAPY
jgi:hypothetical protein